LLSAHIFTLLLSVLEHLRSALVAPTLSCRHRSKLRIELQIAPSERAAAAALVLVARCNTEAQMVPCKNTANGVPLQAAAVARAHPTRPRQKACG
jgi:hypothetical protein